MSVVELTIQPRPLPPLRVERPRLVRTLQDPRAAVISIVAPAGYGKTALLCEWSERDPRPFSWITGGAREVRAELRRATQLRGSGRVVVLDDAHLLRGPAALDALDALIQEAGPELTIALAARRPIALPIARLREQRLVTDIGPRDLAMSRSEATGLLALSGLELDRETVDLLVARTEGWPAGLSLAALAVCEQVHPSRFGGEDRLVAEYLRDEVLADLSPEHREFALRTSVLGTLSGAACDAVLRRSGSGGVLAELARSGLLLVPLDRADERYRFHRLLAEMLRAELRRRSPELDRELHRRASAWHQSAGDRDLAVQHAIWAGDVDGAGRLVWDTTAEALGHGRRATVERWLGHFTQHEITEHTPLAATAAAEALARGRGDIAAHWLDAAVAAAGNAPSADAGVALLRAALARDGLAGMQRDAEVAYGLEAEGSSWRPTCRLLAGTAHLLAGRRDAAVRELEQGARSAVVAAPDVHALCLTQLAVLAAAEEDWEAAAGLVTRARSQVDRHGLADAAATALVLAASAVVRARRGRLDEAQSDLRAATRLQASLVDVAPWFAAEVRVLTGHAAARLGDMVGARIALAEASRLMRDLPDAVALQRWLDDARARRDAFAGPANGSSGVLTAAELRVLCAMPTHLSFREIAERAHVSANTVKSQANAIYRKLGVSCRSEAVSRAREIGVLET